MPDERPSDQEAAQAAQIRKLQAQARTATALAAVGSSFIALGCLMPVITLLVLIIWAVYGGTAAVLAVLIPVLLVAAVFSLVFASSRR